MMRRLATANLALFILLLLLIRASSGAMDNPFTSFASLGNWVAAVLTLCALSFLYGDNPFYRICEHILVGVTAAYWMVLGFWRTLVPNLLAQVMPEIPVVFFDMDVSQEVSLIHRLVYCVPLLLGLLLLARLHPRGRKYGTWTLAFIMGTTAGLRLMGHLDANFMGQIGNSITPLLVLDEEGLDVGRTLDALLLSGGVICCLCYFYYSRRDARTLGRLGKAGLWILMVTFGAGFGFTVMGRIALLVGRVEFLLQDWLKVI